MRPCKSGYNTRTRSDSSVVRDPCTAVQAASITNGRTDARNPSAHGNLDKAQEQGLHFIVMTFQLHALGTRMEPTAATKWLVFLRRRVTPRCWIQQRGVPLLLDRPCATNRSGAVPRLPPRRP